MAAIATALTARSGEISETDGFRACGARCLAQCAAIGVAAGLAALGIGRLLGVVGDARRGALPFIDLCLLGPVAEEIVYRGLVLRRGHRLMPAGWPIAVSALIFGASHGSPAGMAMAAAAGLLFGWARQRKGTVLAPIVIHAVMNGIQYFFA